MESHPMFKVEITHGATTNTYICDKFTPISVTRRENGFSTAILTATNKESALYGATVASLDTLKIYFRNREYPGHTATTWQQVFEGTTYKTFPSLAQNKFMKIEARGLGYALEATHCNTNYGAESSNSSLNTPQEIWQDLVDNYINKSFGGSATGYSVTKTKIANIASALSITFLNSPYQCCREIIDRVCQIVCAYQAGAAGPHYFVDTSGNLIINTIGAHENPAEWPDWWNTDQAGSTLEEGKDFRSYTVADKAEEFCNKIVFLTDFRRPGYDYWTNNQSGLWGSSYATLSDEASVKLVGSHSLRVAISQPAETNEWWYPTAKNAGWDVTDWGSPQTIPETGLYLRRSGTVQDLWMALATSDAHKYYRDIGPELTNANEWYHLSYPIGPYHGRSEIKQDEWSISGSTPDWANINFIYFVGTWADGVYVYFDDLHFGKGKIIREAYNSTSITANKEHQGIFISQTAMDDSGVATVDSGTAARYAYAELLRRQKIPLTVTFTASLKPAMLPGQKLHFHGEKKSDATFTVDKDMRILALTHNMALPYAFTTVTATDDLTNTFPLTTLDQKRLINEYILVNNKEALDMRGGTVDLLIPHLAKDYPS